jgi:hypothetical protein
MATSRKVLRYSFSGNYIMSCDVAIGDVVARRITVSDKHPGQGILHIEIPTHSEAGELIGDQLRDEFSGIAEAVFRGVEDAAGVVLPETSET